MSTLHPRSVTASEFVQIRKTALAMLVSGMGAFALWLLFYGGLITAFVSWGLPRMFEPYVSFVMLIHALLMARMVYHRRANAVSTFLQSGQRMTQLFHEQFVLRWWGLLLFAMVIGWLASGTNTSVYSRIGSYSLGMVLVSLLSSSFHHNRMTSLAGSFSVFLQDVFDMRGQDSVSMCEAICKKNNAYLGNGAYWKLTFAFLAVVMFLPLFSVLCSLYLSCLAYAFFVQAIGNPDALDDRVKEHQEKIPLVPAASKV